MLERDPIAKECEVAKLVSLILPILADILFHIHNVGEEATIHVHKTYQLMEISYRLFLVAFNERYLEKGGIFHTRATQTIVTTFQRQEGSLCPIQINLNKIDYPLI